MSAAAATTSSTSSSNSGKKKKNKQSNNNNNQTAKKAEVSKGNTTKPSDEFLSYLSTVHPLAQKIDWKQIALGTYLIKGVSAYESTRIALKLGYRRLDSAAVYRNEFEVGAAVRDSGLSRAEVHVTSKIAPADTDTAETSYAAVVTSLAKFQFDYLDLHLIHWPGKGGLKPNDPNHGTHRLGTWLGLQQAFKEGKLKAIGVSNFEVSHLQELMASEQCTVKPMVNQFELHPLLYQTQKPLIEFCRKNGIVVQAYSPLGSGASSLLTNSTITSISAKHQKTPGQVLLRWGYQHGFEVLPKTKTRERLLENALAVEEQWQLSQEEMEEIDQMETKFGTERYCWNPRTVA